jgi:hypothetical protein
MQKNSVPLKEVLTQQRRAREAPMSTMSQHVRALMQKVPQRRASAFVDIAGIVCTVAPF